MVTFIKESGCPIIPPPEPQFDALAMGERLRDARETAGLDQTQWAGMIGKSSQAVSNWEVGRASPGPADLLNYAARLGVDIHWVISGQQFTVSEFVQAVVRVTIPKKPLQAD